MKKYIRQHVIGGVQKLGNYFGYELIPQWQIKELPLTRHLCALFEKYEIDVVVDVGANTGQYRDLLRNNINFNGHILSFEPIKIFTEQMKARAKNDSAWDIYNCALGGAPGEALINVASETTLTSFLSPNAALNEGLWGDGSIARTEIAQIRTLDDVLAAAGIDCKRKRVYLKLDTQGFDLEVLKGATKSIENIVALQTEASIVPIYENMPSYRMALDYLDNLGYQISGMFPVNYDRCLRLIEFDCVQINKRAIPAGY